MNKQVIAVLAAGVGLVTLMSIFKKNVTLTYHVYQADNETWTFAIYKGDKLVYEDDKTQVFADQAAAETAAKIWISNNPNAGR